MSLLPLLVRMTVVSRRSLAGVVAYAAVLGILYATPGPLDEVYVPTSVALVAITAWLVVSGLGADRSTVLVLAASAGGRARWHAYETVAAAVVALPLAAGSVLWGWLVAQPPRTGLVLAIGALAHVAAVLVGAGLGAIAAPSVVGEAALAPVIVVAGLVLVAVVPFASPLGPILSVLGDETVGSSALWQCLGWTVACAGWAAVLIALGGAVASRRR